MTDSEPAPVVDKPSAVEEKSDKTNEDDLSMDRHPDISKEKRLKAIDDAIKRMPALENWDRRDVIRFLLSQKFNVAHAIRDMKKYAIWEETKQIRLFQKQQFGQLMCTNFITISPITDKEKRMLIYINFAFFPPWKLEKEMVVVYFAYRCRRCLEVCKKYNLKHTISLIIDMGQFDFNNHFRKEYLLAILQTGADYFPETLGKVFIYNAPVNYYLIWKLMKRFLHKDTISKFILTKDSKPIRAEFGSKCLLMKFGGSMKAYLYDVDIWQNKELAPNLMQQPVQMMAQPVYRVPPIPVLVKI
jgi:hypothetical protein